jgi:cytoskeletal protein RodZ
VRRPEGGNFLLHPMAEIGSTLRETRIRKKIDITTVESATKIRAKYLRAIENEEWSVLPGPTYVKTFLRTYAQYLGLDAHLLVDEFAARFEEPEDLELPAFSREQRIRTRVRRVGPPSRWMALGAVALAFVVFLLVLGLTAGDDNQNGSTSRSSEARKTDRGKRRKSSAAAPAPERTPRKVKLEVLARRPVWVCVMDAKDRPRVDALTLAAGAREGPFTSSSFKVTVGNGGGDLRINGKLRDTPERSEPVGYDVRPSGAALLPASQQPTCG